MLVYLVYAVFGYLGLNIRIHMICARCHMNEASMIHARRNRMDGTSYIVWWCKDCQRNRHVKKPVTQPPLYARTKINWNEEKREAWDKLAKETELRIAAKYAKPSRPTIEV